VRRIRYDASPAMNTRASHRRGRGPGQLLGAALVALACTVGCGAAPTEAAQAPAGAAARPKPADAAPKPADAVSKPSGGTPATEEPRLRLEMLDNGAFAETNAAALDLDGIRRIPWWRSTRGMEQVVDAEKVSQGNAGGSVTSKPRPRTCARTAGSEFVEQPVAAYAPWARSLVVSGAVHGRGRVIVRVVPPLDDAAPPDGSAARPADNGEAAFEYGAAGAWTDFFLTGDEVAARLGHEPVPRFVVRFEAAEPDRGPAHWSALSASVELPCPSEAALREELFGVLQWVFGELLTRGIDSVGPRKTGWFCHDFDALTGERIWTAPAVSYYPLFDLLRMALAGRDVPEWRAAFDAFVRDLLELGMHPTTGLPRAWACETDTPRDDLPIEIGLTLGFLLDVAEQGPEKWRAPCRAAAVRAAETVLAQGILPDGNVAASYFPGTARPNLAIGRLRRLDVLVQLARISALTGEKRFALASEEALRTFQYSHLWSGTWQQIDPAFDDEYGHYGARAATSWKAVPGEPVFREIALGGWKHFQPLWTDSVRLGGTCAADQVRCWVLLMDVAAQAPSERDAIRAATWAAVRGHFKGEQTGSGAWEDLTVIDFDPQLTFAQKVGDVPGPPQNLLHGLSAVYEPGFLRTDEVRAMFTTVLRSSVATYKRPHGFLMERSERKGPNTALGSVRVLLGLSKMFSKLK
jgi:hypothetical protein